MPAPTISLPVTGTVPKTTTKASLETAVNTALAQVWDETQGLTKADVGLANVDNTSDVNKPVSTAQQSAIDDAMEELKNGLASGGSQGAVRPGDFPDAFAGALVGDWDALIAAAGTVVTDEDMGEVVEIAGAGIVALRRAVPLELGRVYNARFTLKRRTNSIDPLGDGVVKGIQWLDEDQLAISQWTSAISPMVADGMINATPVSFSRDLENAEVTIPAGALYARPFIQTYGTTPVTRIGLVAFEDYTSPDAAASLENALRAELAATNADADRVQTGLDRTQTGLDRTAAAGSASAAATSAADALNAALASGPVIPYATKAAANTALAGLAANTVVEVSIDESLGNRRTRYRKTGGVYVFELYVDGIQFPATRAAMKALPTGQPAYLTEALRQGMFMWDSSILIATHTADTDERTFVAPNPAADGAWVRQGVGGMSSVIKAEDVIRARPLVAGRQAKIESVSELTDPATTPAGTQVVLLGSPPITAYCDGVRWWDLTGGSEITPWWLPRGAILHCDFTNSRFYWDGATRVIGDLTAVSGAAYSLNYGFGFTDTAIVVIDTTQDQVNDMTGTIFSWTTGWPTGNRIEFVKSSNATYGDNIRVFLSPRNGGAADFQTLAVTSKDGEAGAVYRGDGIWRDLVRFKNNEALRSQPDNGEYRTLAFAPGTLGTPTRIGFSCRAWASGTPDDLLADAVLRRVTIYTSELTAQHIAAIGRGPVIAKPPVHLLGDSFLNLYDVWSRLKEDTVGRGYIGFSQDGVGGNTITQHAERYMTLNAKWRDSTLVICEMGWDGVWADTEIALKRILGGLTHDRWLIVEPAPNVNTGSPARTTFDELVSKIKDFAGDRWVPTLDAAMALATASPEDVAKVANRRWPTSLTISDTDFHPNRTTGSGFMAGQIYDALLAKGWI